MSTQIIPPEIWLNISSYLPFIEKYSIHNYLNKDVNNYAKKYDYQKEFREHLINKLKTFVENPEEFLLNLKKNNVYMSGSFILDVLYDTNYSNDVDLYIKIENDICHDKYYGYNNNNIFDIYTYNHPFSYYLYELNAKRISSLIEIKIRNIKSHKAKAYRHQCLLSTLREFELNNKKIQCIFTNIECNKFIDIVFDLDICKNYHDGEKLTIKHMNKLISKKDTIKPLNSVVKFLYKTDANSIETRTTKYIERGFEIKKHELYDDIQKEIEEKINNYRKGFNDYDKENYQYLIDVLEKYSNI